MDSLAHIFGTGRELDAWHMMCRAGVVFFIALVLLRISGRRSFGVGTPLDNIILILLGGVLARTITGSSPFIPTVAACAVIAVLHRILGYVVAGNKKVSTFVDGEKIILYKDGNFIPENMTRALVSEEDIFQSLRTNTNSTRLDNVDSVYIERNGEISIVLRVSK